IAHADAGTNAAADALFNEGRRLMADGQFAEACPKFLESEQLRHGLGTLLNLADCFEKVGRTASAWTTFREVDDEATKAGDAARKRVAHERIEALEPRLSKLIVDVPHDHDLPGLEVRKDGSVVGRASWGVPIPVDPGKHSIAAVAR